jgi:hypothetical protein
MTRLTSAREREIDELRAAITPGEWSAVPQTDGSKMICHEFETGKQMNPKGLRLIAHSLARKNSLAEDEANAAFIAAAPQIVDDQKAEIEALRARVTEFELGVAARKEQVRVISAQNEALRAENARMKGALKQITKAPSHPFPDAGAHSWQVLAEAVYRAFCDVRSIARAALTRPQDTEGKTDG